MLAKKSKTVYDGLMRKSYLNILIFFSFLVAFFFLVTPSYACSINANPNSFPSDYNGNVTITTPDCNFQTSVKYTILAHPQNVTSGGLYMNYAVDRKNPQDSQTIIANLNLLQGSIGKSNPGTWTLEVCSKESPLSECANQNNIVSKTYIAINAAPTPTPTQTPLNLPKIDPLVQSKCLFQIGEEVILTATKIQPNTNYSWWWKSDGSFATHKPVGKSDASGSNLTVTVPSSETTKAEKRQLCVDIEGQARVGENCILLTFTTNPPTGNASCTQPVSIPNPVNYPNVSPPCAEFKNGKCIAVDTAVGKISTEPQAFVRSIFTIVLGLSGGIALILIIVSGYKFMTSKGNPEAVKAATEQLTSAIVGLLFIIFSFVILQIIGVDILQIPGFTK